MGIPSANETQSRPWGKVAGLLGACLVTLVGVVRGIDPDVILLRAFCGAIVCGVVGVVAGGVIRWLLRSP